MNEEKAHTGKRNGNKYLPAVVAIIGAALGSTGTVAIVFNTPFGQSIARPDPFTGTQAASLKAEIMGLREILTRHLDSHPDEVNKFDRRITYLEAQTEVIIRNQERMLDRLD